MQFKTTNKKSNPTILWAFLVPVLAAVLCLPTATADAQGEGTVTGLFEVSYLPDPHADSPRIESIQVKRSNVAVESLIPFTWHDIEVTVYQPSGMKELNQLRLKLWYDGSGSGANISEIEHFTPYNQHQVNGHRDSILVNWTPAGASISYAYATLWQLAAGGSGSLYPAETHANEETFTFKFRVRVSKVARATSGGSVWQIGARTTDKSSRTAYAYYTKQGAPTPGLPMEWYGEIAVSAGTEADWGGIPAGIDFDHPLARADVNKNITYIVNGNHYRQLKVSEIWTGAKEDNTVRLSADAAEDNTFALQASFGNPALNPTKVNISSPDSFYNIRTWAITTEDGFGHELSSGINNLYIKLNSAIEKDYYSGTVTYGVANQN
jgi:hypothetical protein